MTESILGMLAGIPQWLQIFIISMLPIVELRGAIPVATAYGMDALSSYALCVIGNMLPIPFLLLLIRPVLAFMRKTKGLKKFGDWLHNRSISKSDKIQATKYWGLFIFVAIPLPGTGAWTGAVIAALLEMDYKKSILAILAGVMTAGVIMLFGSNAVAWLISLF